MTETTNELAEKELEIIRVLEKKEVDAWKLREFAITEGGLVNDEIRKAAWPLLAGVQGSPAASRETLVVPCSDDCEIISWDVSRCWHLLSREEREQKSLLDHMRDREVVSRIKMKQQGLIDVINSLVMLDNVDMFYYQGFHELASIFFNVLSPSDNRPDQIKGSKFSIDVNLPIAVLFHLAQTHLMDLLKGDFSHLDSILRLSLFPLLAKIDPQVHEHLHECSIYPTFAVSWIVTWFSHDVRDTDIVKRLFDFFLVSHPLMPFYVTVALITHPFNRQRILQCEREFSQVYSVLRELPKSSNTDANSKNTKLMDYDPFADSDASTASESGFSLDTRSKDFSTLERVFHDIAEETESELREGSDSSTTACHREETVPLEDFLDLALDYIQRIPPAKLPTLAKKYYGVDESQELLSEAAKIGICAPPPPTTLHPMSLQHPIALTAMGLGREVNDRMLRAARRKCIPLSLLAVLVFTFTFVTVCPKAFDGIDPARSSLHGTACHLKAFVEYMQGPGMSRVLEVKDLLQATTSVVMTHAANNSMRKLSGAVTLIDSYRNTSAPDLAGFADLFAMLHLNRLTPRRTGRGGSDKPQPIVRQQLVEQSICLGNTTGTPYSLLLSQSSSMSTTRCLLSLLLGELQTDRSSP